MDEGSQFLEFEPSKMGTKSLLPKQEYSHLETYNIFHKTGFPSVPKLSNTRMLKLVKLPLT